MTALYIEGRGRLIGTNCVSVCCLLQLYRSLRVPITSRMLSDILSRLVETVAEQGEDMQV